MAWLESRCGMVCEWVYLTSCNLSICNPLFTVDVIGVYMIGVSLLLLVALFGTDLTAVCPPGEVPSIVETCTLAIEEKGMVVEGVYRVPARQTEVTMLKKMFEEGEYLLLCQPYLSITTY